MSLISNYAQVIALGLREAANRAHPKDSPYSTYSHEYYVEYVTLSADGRLHEGIRSQWNCATLPSGRTDYRHNGFPASQNLATWASNHERIAENHGVELLVARAVLRRSKGGEVVAE